MNIRLLFTTLLATVITTGFSQKMFSNGDEWIPPDFKAPSTTLLIARLGQHEGFGAKEKEYQAALEFMQESYPYPYEFTYIADTAKLTDRAKYRYLLLSTVVDVTYNTPDFVRGIDFYIYDRVTRTRHHRTKKPSSSGMTTFKPVIRTLAARQ